MAQTDSCHFFLDQAEKVFEERKFKNKSKDILYFTNKALVCDSLNSRANYINAVCYCITAKQDRLDSSFMYINRALKSKPLCDTLIAFKGFLFSLRFKFNEAIQEMNKAIKINPCYSHYYRRSGFYSEVNMYDSALNDINMAIVLLLNEKYLTEDQMTLIRIFYLYRGDIFLNKKQKKEACEDWYTALKMGDEYAELRIKENCK